MIYLAWLVHRSVAEVLGLCGVLMLADVLLILCRELIHRGKGNHFLPALGFLSMSPE